jgi:phage portal protein BeeE
MPFKKSNEKSNSSSPSVAANVALARQQTWKQIKTYKSTYCIGFCANCLVVFIVLLLSSAIAQFPVIYLRVAELRAGELDIVRNRTDNPKKEKKNST